MSDRSEAAALGCGVLIVLAVLVTFLVGISLTLIGAWRVVEVML